MRIMSKKWKRIKKAGCPFCEKSVREPGIRRESNDVISFVPLNPVVEGHRLFVPDNHCTTEDSHSVALAMTLANLHGQREGVDYNLILNSGTFASQTIGHIHVHYIPRYEGDDLYLPWTNQER